MLVIRLFPFRIITLVIDDFITVRASRPVPPVDLYHDHATRQQTTVPLGPDESGPWDHLLQWKDACGIPSPVAAK